MTGDVLYWNWYLLGVKKKIKPRPEKQVLGPPLVSFTKFPIRISGSPSGDPGTPPCSHNHCPSTKEGRIGNEQWAVCHRFNNRELKH